MRKHYSKLIGSCIVVLCMVLTMAFFVQADDNTEEIRKLTVESYSSDSLNTLIQEQKNNGYLYAGLFKSDSTELSKSDAIRTPEEGTSYIAKFVPAGVLTAKAQVSGALLKDETLAESSIRFVTTIDSLSYKEVGFSVARTKDDGTVVELVDPETITEYVYTKLYAVDATDTTGGTIDYEPTDIHPCSIYFKAYTITGVPSDFYNADLTVIPYWVTYDGVKVEGLTAIKTVNLGRAWIYVDAEATESAQLGTYNAPYTTIGGAVGHVTKLEPTVIVKNDMTMSETVTISRNVTLTSESTATLTRGSEFTGEFFNVGADYTLTMNKISGDNTLILDGAKDTVSASKPLASNSGTLVINDGVTLQNNKNSGNGGAIYLDEKANLTMNGGTISGNTASGNGGAIHAEKTSYMELSDVELSNNTASQGGAINLPAADAEEDSLALNNVTITNNATTTKSSGAVYVGSKRKIEINGDDTVISGNSSKTTGGAFGTGAYAKVTMNAGTISENEANSADGGGAVFLWQATFVMNGGTISENTAQAVAGKGGAISAGSTSTITINDGTIEKNEAVNGGAIYLNSQSKSGSTLTINGGTICENGADMATTGLGGGIYMASYTTFVMTGGTIKDNEAITSKGEGVYCLGSTFKIGGDADLNDEVYLANATPITVTSELTNAVGKITRYEYTADAVIAQTADNVEADLTDKFVLGTAASTCTVSEGQVKLGTVASTEVATYDALTEAITNASADVTIQVTADIAMTGTIMVPSGVNVTLIGTGNLTRGTDFKDEFFNILSGATLTMAGMGQEKTLTLNGGYDSSDTSTRASKPLIINAGTLTMMEDVVLKDNYNTTTSTNLSGAILTSGICNIVGGMIQNTHGANNYGSIYVSTGTLNMTGGVITQGTMRGVFVNNGKFILDGGVITGNIQASGSGAGVVINKNDSGTNEFLMESGIISYNEATTNAGGINLGGVGAVMTMNGGTIRGNIAKGTGTNAGGAIYMSSNTKLTITGGAIKNNETKGSNGGGAIFASTSKGILISGGTISGNKASNTSANGGAISLTNATTLTMTGGILKGNTAGANGGAIHAVAASTIDLSNIELSDNTATGQGGAINLPAGSESAPGNLMKLTNVTMKKNQAMTKSSGAIYVGAYRKLEINGDETVFSDNISGTYGGAIGTGNGAEVTMNGGTISSNTANGGAGGGILVNTNVVFTMNGGAINSNAVASGYTGENVHINANGSLKLSGVADVASVYCVGANAIKVTEPLTAQNITTVITLQEPTIGATVVSCENATEAEMEELLSVFSLNGYTLKISDTNLVVAE